MATNPLPNDPTVALTDAEVSRREFKDNNLREAALVQRIQTAQANDILLQQGWAAVARLQLDVIPTATDTVTIGTDVYEFVATAGAVADDANIAVEIKGSAALTLAEFVAAINQTADAAHPNITDVATTGAALGRGTEAVWAVTQSTDLYIYETTAAGESTVVLGAGTSIVLSETLTDAEVWSSLNLNVEGAATTSAPTTCVADVDVTAAMVTGGGLSLVFPFTVKGFTSSIKTSAGITRAYGSDTLTQVSATILRLTIAGGDIADGDDVSILAWG